MKPLAQIQVDLAEGGAVVTCTKPAAGPHNVSVETRVVPTFEALSVFLRRIWEETQEPTGLDTT